MINDTDDRMLEAGQRAAMEALQTHKSHVETLSDRERLHWWCGFLTAGMGGAIASLGEPALRAVREALAGNEESERKPRRSYLPK